MELKITGWEKNPTEVCGGKSYWSAGGSGVLELGFWDSVPY